MRSNIPAYRSSVEMAKERGAFSLYDAKREEANPYINRLKDADPSLYDEMIKYYGNHGVAIFRKHLHEYSKGIENASSFREEINHIANSDLMRDKILEFFKV